MSLRRPVVLAALALTGTFFVLPAGASSPGLSVTAAGAPAAPAGAYPVQVLVRNASGPIACSALAIVVTWSGANRVEHRAVAEVTSILGVASSTFTLPVAQGLLHYRVSAAQYCGLFGRGEGRSGSSAPQDATIL